MSKISLLMDTGKRSMMNNQTALQTVGHNIANKSTEGYSRQRVELQTNTPVLSGRFQVGTGSKAAQITRVNNPFLEKQIQKEGGHGAFLEARAEAMAGLEEVYNEQVNKGLSQNMAEFFNAFRELATYPESVANRMFVRDSAQIMASEFHRVQKDLTNAQGDLNSQIQVHVEDINQMVREVATLNEKIASVEIQGIPNNDARDRRDLLIKKLNEKIDISWSENDIGQVSITAGRIGILVSGQTHQELITKPSENGDKIDVYFKAESGQLAPMNHSITGGKLGAILEVRDKTIEEFKNNLDTLAYTFAAEVNRIHQQGVDLKGRAGQVFFNPLQDVKGAAAQINLNEFIQKDTNRIVTGLPDKGVADNTVANVIAQLQSRTVLNDGTATFDDFYRASVADVGVLAQRARSTAETQKNVVNQLQNLRESISGVSLDEEATKMIEYQKGYDASARLIRTADELFDTLLSLKRL